PRGTRWKVTRGAPGVLSRATSEPIGQRTPSQSLQPSARHADAPAVTTLVERKASSAGCNCNQGEGEVWDDTAVSPAPSTPSRGSRRESRGRQNGRAWRQHGP